MEKDLTFNFENLIIYQKALDYLEWVYKTTAKLPKEEIYGLTSQFRRAAQSIAFNIAEGAGETKKQFSRYLSYTRASIKECVVCTTVSLRLGYITNEEYLFSRQKLTELAKMNSSLIRSQDTEKVPDKKIK